MQGSGTVVIGGSAAKVCFVWWFFVNFVRRLREECITGEWAGIGKHRRGVGLGGIFFLTSCLREGDGLPWNCYTPLMGRSGVLWSICPYVYTFGISGYTTVVLCCPQYKATKNLIGMRDTREILY